MRCDVTAVGGIEDHIHLLVNLPGRFSLAELMKRVKGGSSVFISQELLGGQWFAWQAHYDAFAVAPESVSIAVAYITNQKQHHTEGSLRPDWEETEMEYDDEPVSNDPTDI
jgi:REP element-mobilizing transposase RayT